VDIFKDNEVDVIYDDDLVDASDSISLSEEESDAIAEEFEDNVNTATIDDSFHNTNSVEMKDLSMHSDPDKHDSTDTKPTAYSSPIEEFKDNEGIDKKAKKGSRFGRVLTLGRRNKKRKKKDVMKDADELLKEEDTKHRFWHSPKNTIICIGIFLFLLSAAFIVVAFNTPLSKQVLTVDELVDQQIEEKGTAYDFNDHDEYETPIYSFGYDPNDMEQSNSLLDKEISLAQGVEFPLPIKNFFVDFTTTVFDVRYETPFFWQIPSSGGIFQSIMTACYKKILATDIHWNKEERNDTLKILQTINNHSYVNVDLSLPEDIKKAGNEGLVSYHMADIVASPHIHYSAIQLFSNQNKGRMFTVFRHPVERIIAICNFIQKRQKKESDVSASNSTSSMTLLEFALSPNMDKNWMTSFLVNKRQTPLTQDDVELAKEILRRKALVGIHDKMESSLKVFQDYFHWKPQNEFVFEKCKASVINNDKARARETFNRMGVITTDDEDYQKIANLNWFDMQLYWYAVDLHEEQKIWVSNNKGELVDFSK